MACFSKARRLFAALFFFVVSGSPGQTPEKENLVPVRSMQMQDKQGVRWDFSQSGSLGYGSNGAFSNGAQLKLDGNQFNIARPMMTADGKEFVFAGSINNVTVTRRVRLDSENGAVRYLEIFQSPAAPFRGSVTIHSDLGSNAQQVVDLKAKIFTGALAKDEGAFVVECKDGRPSIVFIVADPKAKAKPQVRMMNNNRSFDVTYALDLPKGGTVAFVHYVALRMGGSAAEGRELLASYYKRGRLIDPSVSKDWLKLLANFSAGPAEDEKNSPLLLPLQEIAENAEIVRGKLDTVLLEAGSKLAGTVSGGDFELETVFGKTPVTFAQVAGLEGGASVMRPIRVFLRDGEILTGDVKGAKVAMTTESGLNLEIDLGQLNLLVMRTAEQDGIPPAKARMLVTTQRGDRLTLTDDGAPVEVATPWGMAKVPLAQLRSLTSIREPFPAQRVTLEDRSRFIAMMRAVEWSAPTLRFGTVKLAPQGLREMQRIGEALLPSDDAGDEPKLAGPHCEVLGESRLAGTIDLPALHLVAESNVTAITPSQIVQLEAQPSDTGERFVTVKLVDGQELKGRLTENVLPIRAGDRVWRVPAAHLVAYRVPQPEPGETKTAVEAKPAAAPKELTLPSGVKLPPAPLLPP